MNQPTVSPPKAPVAPIQWMRNNLFNTWYNSLLTLAVGYLLVTSAAPLLNWVFLDATFSGESPSDCVGEGACWLFINQRLNFFIYGFYPEDQQWRINLMFGLLALSFIPQFIEGFPARRWLGIFGMTGLPILGYILIPGGSFGLESVPSHRWGGLMLTLILAYVGIFAALPIGILLALGRRSHMPVIRGFCVVFIEVWRAVPLITVLFMASVMLPLFLPEGMNFEKLLRALIGITLWQSAYMAEVVRGGLQAIPRGQYEAASALGLGYWKKMGLIILPQALKLVIPGIVNTFIALFKDTTLVLIIGLFDVLGAVQSTVTDPAWQNVAIEGYVFVAFCFWVFCFGMSRYSQNLERKLDTGHRT
ncbi:amino acid ABC transporter permease [Marinobacter zhejiangensis]|uniref:Amino acid ABC transporter membrane protein 2, PAAT family n=1 Tax=Marinobacter zhejiangensis TaxID=488535 RepID=A0A1I4Q6R2_9GAMM|nr:amino acid ABC transporter permease [Marinobacter zhejiangensis]SFM35303.1 amino acid ABC transporter membrane protein 2, PAAT family [Marinobacter zhejiangensis]